MSNFSKIELLDSRTVSYIVTTGFNFISITLLLLISYSYVEPVWLATLTAQTAGVLVSMWFSLDVWWSKVSREMDSIISLSQRLRFCGIASVSVVITTTLSYIFGPQVGQITGLLLLNWATLVFVSISKYLVMILVVQKTTFFRSGRSKIPPAKS